MRNSVLLSGMVGLSLIGLSTPRSVHAQITESAEVRNTLIRLNTEGSTLYAALKMLFGQAKADFTIVDSLKSLPVTVNLKQPFRVALDSVLKAAGQPITYEFAAGIYRIIPAPDEPQAEPIIEPAVPEEAIIPQIFKPYIVVRRPRNLNGIDIATLLGGTVIRWRDGFPADIGAMPDFFGGAGMMGGYGGGMGMNGGFGMGGFGGLSPQNMGIGGLSPFSQGGYR